MGAGARLSKVGTRTLPENVRLKRTPARDTSERPVLVSLKSSWSCRNANEGLSQRAVRRNVKDVHQIAANTPEGADMETAGLRGQMRFVEQAWG